MSPMITRRMGAGDADLAHAAELLIAGELVGIPTETVYGLAVRADDPAAIERLYAAKGRPSDNPLIVHVASLEALGQVARDVTPLAALLLEHFAPGPLTVVLEAHPDLPREVTAGLDTVAVRIPDHPVALEVLRRCGVPLAAPSANRSGRPSPTTAAHVLDDLDGRIAAVVDGGPTRLGLESTVVDARGSTPTVLREGAVTREELLRACEAPASDKGATPGADDRSVAGPGTGPDPAASVLAPGTRHRHYAPGLPVHLADPSTGPTSAAALLDDLRTASSGSGSDITVGLVTVGSTASTRSGRSDPATDRAIVLLGAPADATALAAELFALLRRAEDLGLTALVIEQVSDAGIGRAVMDRLRRASEASGGASRETVGPVS